MTKDIRFNKMISLLEKETSPLSGSNLASILGVSRQVVVSYISLAKARGYNIISTNKGYLLNQDHFITEEIKSCHSIGDICNEFYTIVDFGGTIVNVTIDHKLYGKMSIILNLRTRYDVDCYINEVKNTDASLLEAISVKEHFHQISCRNVEVLNLIKENLNNVNKR